MPIEVFDYRVDVRNVVITPEIRARFMRMEPGEVASRHSHDLGQEVFLVLEGRCEFEIEGDRAVLGPGQMCFARLDQLHHVRTVGDEPMTMYLSVTPHIEPTHTWWDDDGDKLPPRYGVATERERAVRRQSSFPLTDFLDRHLAEVRALTEAAQRNAQAQETAATALLTASKSGDESATKAAVDAMWDSFSETFRRLQAVSTSWNELAPAAAETDEHP